MKTRPLVVEVPMQAPRPVKPTPADVQAAVNAYLKREESSRGPVPRWRGKFDPDETYEPGDLVRGENGNVYIRRSDAT